MVFRHWPTAHPNQDHAAAGRVADYDVAGLVNGCRAQLQGFGHRASTLARGSSDVWRRYGSLAQVSTSSLLAVIAIGISGLTLLWTIFWSIYTHRRSTLTRLVVRTAFSVPVGYDNRLWRAAVDISATNTGAVTVTVTGAAIQVKGKKETLSPMEWVVQQPSPLPLVLEPGKHWSGLVDAGAIIDALARKWGPRKEWVIRGAAHDPAGNTYRARKWMTLDVGAVGVFAKE
jgi:hypothetical protein